jgi:hypothetical protein
MSKLISRKRVLEFLNDILYQMHHTRKYSSWDDAIEDLIDELEMDTK